MNDLSPTSARVPRRSLHFHTLDDILDDAQSFDGRAAVRTTGSWSAAQIVWHVDEFMRRSRDGFGFALPLPLRVVARMLRGRILRAGFRPGLKPPRPMQAVLPPAEVSWDEALARLRDTIARANAGERFEQPSPLFGRMSHEQWVQMHCRHAELHFSFIAGVDGRG